METAIQIVILFFVIVIFAFIAGRFIAWLVLQYKTSRKAKTQSNYNDLGISTQKKIVYELQYAIKYLSKNKIGALITIEQQVSLDQFRTDGVAIDAKISASLLIALFNKKSPLHDGAVIILNDRIAFASTYFSVSESPMSDHQYGARHRAALGIAEVTDSITIVVSETTGEVLLARHSQFVKIPNLDKFVEILEQEMSWKNE